jgi:hypothetical protein
MSATEESMSRQSTSSLPPASDTASASQPSIDSPVTTRDFKLGDEEDALDEGEILVCVRHKADPTSQC